MSRPAVLRPAFLLPPPFGGLAPLGKLFARRSCAARAAQTRRDGQVMLHIQLRYTQSSETFRTDVADVAERVAEVPGLIWKLWAETGTGQAAATCLFATRDAAKQYVEMMRAEGPGRDPRYLDVTFRLMDVITDASRATRALA